MSPTLEEMSTWNRETLEKYSLNLTIKCTAANKKQNSLNNQLLSIEDKIQEAKNSVIELNKVARNAVKNLWKATIKVHTHTISPLEQNSSSNNNNNSSNYHLNSQINSIKEVILGHSHSSSIQSINSLQMIKQELINLALQAEEIRSRQVLQLELNSIEENCNLSDNSSPLKNLITNTKLEYEKANNLLLENKEKINTLCYDDSYSRSILNLFTWEYSTGFPTDSTQHKLINSYKVAIKNAEACFFSYSNFLNQQQEYLIESERIGKEVKRLSEEKQIAENLLQRFSDINNNNNNNNKQNSNFMNQSLNWD